MRAGLAAGCWVLVSVVGEPRGAGDALHRQLAEADQLLRHGLQVLEGGSTERWRCVCVCDYTAEPCDIKGGQVFF